MLPLASLGYLGRPSFAVELDVVGASAREIRARLLARFTGGAACEEDEV